MLTDVVSPVSVCICVCVCVCVCVCGEEAQMNKNISLGVYCVTGHLGFFRQGCPVC